MTVEEWGASVARAMADGLRGKAAEIAAAAKAMAAAVEAIETDDPPTPTS